MKRYEFEWWDSYTATDGVFSVTAENEDEAYDKIKDILIETEGLEEEDADRIINMDHMLVEHDIN